ncbi:N-acetylglucosamine-6-phosphate deacetylase [Vibrio tubiashii]|uniref:N-acetylglucosamine-6-phosphate deacetylase n=1 Tax=Vibrio tubiashii ATCC 19109 TaxID=1051646 RepID=F9T7P2_9VIBR|nr:N-acetylglucosamine-6-phosphate deacetylase [Vibrio tubiashii]AIW16857.1 N-acetylglucosamine-6-phosphate deacetylase [Vibrio tubiashii ATCC 19109]EGU53425.1 N-acetylglucosamine-6-phosphate deacetylase [Vibrio tubiashii ATCC 19109]EIF04602.1 N-acetylglucosamine-6-phosphate deacetylase [Vibrio tubiashii NCIMB 1337 = ATCC 19106]
MALKAISAPRIFDGEQYHNDAALVWKDEQIDSIVAIDNLPQGIDLQHFEGALIAPGFIDIQVNGGGDVMFNNDITPQGIETICHAHRTHGTAYLLPTLISATPDNIQQALSATEKGLDAKISGLLGVHLEGPWLNKEKRGAHDANLFYAPTVSQLEQFEWPTQGSVLVTAAVENIEPSALQWMKDKGITLSCGHSNAKAEQLTEDKLSLVDGFTHLFNAMSPFEGREPGVVGTALNSDHAWCSIITDGIHVHPQSFLLAHKAKPQGKLLIVTDAMATLGSKTNQFELDGETIRVIDNKLVNSRGSLAGAHIGMDESVANVIQWGITEEEALKMASTYPANALSCDNLGKLKPNFRAAATVLDDNYRSQAVLVDGQLY